MPRSKKQPVVLTEEQKIVQELAALPYMDLLLKFCELEYNNPVLANKIAHELIRAVTTQLDTLTAAMDVVEASERYHQEYMRIWYINKRFGEEVWNEYNCRYVYRNIISSYMTPMDGLELLLHVVEFTGKEQAARVIEMLTKGGVN